MPPNCQMLLTSSKRASFLWKIRISNGYIIITKKTNSRLSAPTIFGAIFSCRRTFIIISPCMPAKQTVYNLMFLRQMLKILVTVFSQYFCLQVLCVLSGVS